jgi:hypothetical protein
MNLATKKTEATNPKGEGRKQGIPNGSSSLPPLPPRPPPRCGSDRQHRHRGPLDPSGGWWWWRQRPRAEHGAPLCELCVLVRQVVPRRQRTCVPHVRSRPTSIVHATTSCWTPSRSTTLPSYPTSPPSAEFRHTYLGLHKSRRVLLREHGDSVHEAPVLPIDGLPDDFDWKDHDALLRDDRRSTEVAMEKYLSHGALRDN